MYSKIAAWYDALYSFKDYHQESEQIMAQIRAHHPLAKTVLDAGCGTVEMASRERWLAFLRRSDVALALTSAATPATPH